VDYVHYWADRSQVGKGRIVKWIGLGSSKFYNWQQRYGKATEHNARIPRDHWLEAWERKAIIRGFHAHPDDGYRRLTYLLMDANTVAVSPSTTYRVLKSAGLLQRWNTSNSRKGKGFQQPAQPHEHWHIDISHINICGTFYYLCSILDGASRYLVHWELRESMRESDVEIVLQRAREKFPAATPRIISDNGPQFIAKDFKQFIRVTGMSHVRTSPYYPQSNGKVERWHQTLKRSCIRPRVPLSLDDARTQVTAFVREYNEHRLHSAIGFVTPRDKLLGRDTAIHAERDRKLEAARQSRAARRQSSRFENQGTGEEARREVQEGANERLLACVDAR
jgi:putative transposase